MGVYTALHNRMKYFASLLFIMGFVGVAVFGSALFNMALDHADDCIASSIDGVTCPINITDFATHHISALQAFTRAVAPSDSHWLVLLAPLLLVSVSLFLFHKDLLHPICQPANLLRRLRDLSLRYSSGRQKIISWLSLLELSPAL